MTNDLSKLSVIALLAVLILALAAPGQTARFRNGSAAKPDQRPTQPSSPAREPHSKEAGKHLFAPIVITYSQPARKQPTRSTGQPPAGSQAMAARLTFPPPVKRNMGQTRTGAADITNETASIALKPVLILYSTYGPIVPAGGAASIAGLGNKTNDGVADAIDVGGMVHSPSNVEKVANETSALDTFDETPVEITAKKEMTTPNEIAAVFASRDPLATSVSFRSLSRSESLADAATALNSTAPASIGVETEAVDLIQLNNSAVELASEGRYTEAQALLQQAIAARPATAKFHRNLSIVYEKLNLMENALASAKKAAELSPHDPSVIERLCTIEIDARNWEAAGLCFEKLDSIQPLDSLSSSYYGIALLRSGKADRSLQVLEKASSSSPPVGIAINTLGIAYFELKRLEDAAAAFKRAVEIEPEKNEFRYNLAVAQLSLRNKEGAASQYKILKQRDSKLAARLFQMLFGDKIVVVPKN